MFNYSAIDSLPTVKQIKAIIDYMDNDPNETYNFNFMMDMRMLEPNKIVLNLNNAHIGEDYNILFDDNGEIIEFKKTGEWIS